MDHSLSHGLGLFQIAELLDGLLRHDPRRRRRERVDEPRVREDRLRGRWRCEVSAGRRREASGEIARSMATQIGPARRCAPSVGRGRNGRAPAIRWGVRVFTTMPSIAETTVEMVQLVFPEHAGAPGQIHGGRMMEWITE